MLTTIPDIISCMPNNFLFDLLGPFYDHVIGPKEPDVFCQPLKLPSSGWLLDAGGGTGRASAGLSHLIDHLVICDLSEPMLREAQAKGIQNLVQASATHLPFAGETFDRIMVIDALHHMPDQKNTIGELMRTLKTNGRLLVEEPDIELFGVKLIALFEKLALMKSTFHSPKRIKAMTEEFGAQTEINSDGKGSAWVMADK